MLDHNKSDAGLSKHGRNIAHALSVGQKCPNQTQSLLKPSIGEVLS
jgi:hypothetical protein